MTKKQPYTAAEIAHAMRLYEDAKTNGTLKEPRGIATLVLSNGRGKSVSASVTHEDYLPDARRALQTRPSRSGPRRRKS